MNKLYERIRMLEDEYECCNPNYANGGVLEVKEQIQEERIKKFNKELRSFLYEDRK